MGKLMGFLTPKLKGKADMSFVSKTIKEKLPNTPIYIWTGYLYEELARRGGHMAQILEMADYLIDGPYIEDLRDITLEMRGSSNQRIINLHEVDKD